MRTKVVIVAAVVAALAIGASAQVFGTVKGKVTGHDGQPIAGAVVEWVSPETGRKYSLKTNDKGEYFSIGIQPGKYNVAVTHGGKQIYTVNGVPVSLDERVLDIDLRKEAQAQKQQMTEEQRKQIEALEKEKTTVKALNEKLAAANAAQQAGNLDQAIALLNEAVGIDATRELLWYKLGDLHLTAAASPAGANEHYAQAVAAYTKGLALKPLGAGYNNLGQAYAKSGRIDEAVDAYTKAATLEPTNAGQYYFNLGAVLTNQSMKITNEKEKFATIDKANEAFDKAIAADPNRAEAYYQKATNLVNKATYKPDGTIVAPPGTVEAFEKYLELQPTGPNAESAKAMLEALGQKVELRYKRGKKT